MAKIQKFPLVLFKLMLGHIFCFVLGINVKALRVYFFIFLWQ